MQQTFPKQFVSWLISFVFVWLCSGIAMGVQAQLLTDDFPTAGLLTDNGWNQLGSVATNSITTSAQNLTYAGLVTAGNSASLTTSGQDVSRSFTAQTTGNLYASCLINVATAQNGGDYFIHFASTTVSNTYVGRVFAKSVSGGFQVGIGKTSTSVAYEPTVYSFGTTYFIVFKYAYNPAVGDDVSSLYISPVLGSAEPTPSVTDAGGNDASSLAALNLRQGTASSAPGVLVDYIRVGTAWADVTSSIAATLTADPTTLSNFTTMTGMASAPQVYTLTGTSLTANASVSVTAGFEISTDGTTFATTATVPQTSGAISQTVAVRLASSQTTGSVSGTVTNSSTLATATVVLEGSVTAPVTPPFVGTLANYTFESVNTPTMTAPNVTASNAAFGSGINGVQYFAGNPGQGYSGASWGTTALDLNSYLEFTVTPTSTYQVSVTSVVVDLRRSGTGPQTVELRSSADNFSAAIGSTGSPGNSNFSTVTFPVNPAQNSTVALAFRIYGYGASSTGGTLRFDNLNVNGSVGVSTTPFITVTPSPVSLSYTAGSGPASQVVTVNGSNLSPAAGTLTISSSSTAITATPNTLAYTGGAVNGSLFTVQLVAGLAVGSYPATLTLTNGTTSSILTVDGTVKNAAGTLSLISTIQGSGPASPLVGESVTIEGVVTRTFATTATGLGGFYVQEEDVDSDNNPATSEGIFVYDPSVFFTGTAGDKVRLTGVVSEFFDLTQITLSGAASLTSLGASTLPTATPVVFPVTSVDLLEQYEGMLVVASAATGNLVVTETFDLGRFGRVSLASTGPNDVAGTDARLDQYTQFNAPSTAGYAAYLDEVAKRTIALDDGRDDQYPAQIIFGRGGQPLSATNTLRGGDAIASITAILDYRRGAYRLESATGLDFQPTNPRLATPPAVGGTLKAGSFNVLNYFNTFGTTNFVTCSGNSISARGADNATEFSRQRDKTIRAIINSGVDVMALNEMQNNGFGSNSAIQDLVNGLNAATGLGSYTFVDSGCISTDAITVAMVYKPGSVTLVGPSASLASSSAFNLTGRQPLAQTFRQSSTGGVFTLVANHWKSKGGSGTGSDADSNDGQSAFNGRRTQQAQDLVTWLATKPTGTADPDYLIVGDLNSYAKEDPLTVLETGGYTNLIPNTTYSYMFGGFVGALDHALGSASLPAQITNATKWHINADEPIVLDYNTNFKSADQINSLYNAEPYRASDHDPVIIGLNLTPSLSATLVASTSVCTGSPASLSLTVAGLETGATYSYTISNGTNSTTASGVSASAVQTSVVPTVPGSFTAMVLTSANASTTAASGNVAINVLPANASLTSGTLTCAATSVTLTASATDGTSYTLNGGPTSQTNTSGQFVVSTAGSYTAIIANTSGCTATATAMVTSNTVAPAAPTLTGASRTITPSTTPLPLGQFVNATGSNTLSFSGVNGIVANPPTTNVSTAGAQSFSVTQTDGTGCTSAPTPFTITVQPGTTTTPGSQTVCYGSRVVLNAITAGVRYEWYRNGKATPFKLIETAGIQEGTKATSLTIVGIQTTSSYYCKVFQANGSFTFDGPLKVTVDYTCIAPGARVASSEAVEVPLSVVLAPNPVVDGQLRAVVRGAAGGALSVELVDMKGRAVRQQVWPDANAEQAIEWTMGNGPSGLYLLRVQTPKQSISIKVIKQ